MKKDVEKSNYIESNNFVVSCSERVNEEVRENSLGPDGPDHNHNLTTEKLYTGDECWLISDWPD